MADTKISLMTAAGALTGTEVVPILQSAANKRTTAQAIADLSTVTSAKLDALLGSTRGLTARRGASGWEAIAVGANGTILTSDGTDPSWAAPAAGPSYHPGFASGRYYTKRLSQGVANATVTANRVYAVPFYAPVATTFTKAAIFVQTGVSSTTAEVGLYANSAGAPGALLSHIAQLATTATATLITSTGLTISVPAGWSWLAVAFSGAPSIRSCAATDYMDSSLLGLDSVAAQPIQGFYGSWTYVGGSLPDPFPALNVLSTNTIPLLFLGL